MALIQEHQLLKRTLRECGDPNMPLVRLQWDIQEGLQIGEQSHLFKCMRSLGDLKLGLETSPGNYRSGMKRELGGIPKLWILLWVSFVSFPPASQSNLASSLLSLSGKELKDVPPSPCVLVVSPTPAPDLLYYSQSKYNPRDHIPLHHLSGQLLGEGYFSLIFSQKQPPEFWNC